MNFYIVFIIFVIDRIVKTLIITNLALGEIISVFPFLNITYLLNTGMAFGKFAGSNTILIFIKIAVVIFLIVFIKINRIKQKFLRIAYSLILAGALSNLWDRIFHNGVIDYIDFKIWPVFNIADTVIVIGAFLIMYSMFCKDAS